MSLNPLEHTLPKTVVLVVDEKVIIYNVSSNIQSIPLLFKEHYDNVEDTLSVLQSQAVAITWPGGIGKSAHATAVLHDSRVVQDCKTSRFFIGCEAPLSASEPAGLSISKEKLIRSLPQVGGSSHAHHHLKTAKLEVSWGHRGYKC